MKVSVKYSGPGTTAQTWFEGVAKKMIEGMGDVVEDAVDEGKEITQDNIDTRGTLKSGKRGRIETSKMRDAVDSEITRKGKKGVSGKFGWINEFEPYFGYQEEGFNHVGGVTVDGMYAISDAADEVFKNIEDDFDRIIRGA